MDSNQLCHCAQIKKQKEILLDEQGDISLAAILNGVYSLDHFPKVVLTP